MDDFLRVHSSEVEAGELQRLLAERVAEEQVREFRRFILTCFAILMAAAWVLSWPVHLLPHTVLWSLLATAAFVIGLMCPPRTHATSPDKRSKPRH